MIRLPPIGMLLRSHVERRLLPLFLRADRRHPVEDLGIVLWPVCIDPSTATVYSIGVGEDIDVERRLVERGARSTCSSTRHPEPFATWTHAATSAVRCTSHRSEGGAKTPR